MQDPPYFTNHANELPEPYEPYEPYEPHEPELELHAHRVLKLPAEVGVGLRQHLTEA